MTTTSSLSVQELVPPTNFSLVCPGVYRSGYPTKKNYPFLRALRLRSILYLCPEEYAESNLKFCEEVGITLLRYPTEGNKEPFTDISETLMHRILSALCDTRHHPVLIHCNKGKHRTGTVCGCLRLLQGWSLSSIFREYKAFSGNKARVSDQTFIELYYPIVKIVPAYVARWLGVSPRVHIVFTERELVEEETAQMGGSLLAPMSKPEKAAKKQAQGPAPPAEGGTVMAAAAPPSTPVPAGVGSPALTATVGLASVGSAHTLAPSPTTTTSTSTTAAGAVVGPAATPGEGSSARAGGSGGKAGGDPPALPTPSGGVHAATADRSASGGPAGGKKSSSGGAAAAGATSHGPTLGARRASSSAALASQAANSTAEARKKGRGG